MHYLRQGAARGSEKGVRVLSKWMLQNQTIMRLATSAGGMTALALVVAAPSKWR